MTAHGIVTAVVCAELKKIIGLLESQRVLKLSGTKQAPDKITETMH